MNQSRYWRNWQLQWHQDIATSSTSKSADEMSANSTSFQNVADYPIIQIDQLIKDHVPKSFSYQTASTGWNQARKVFFWKCETEGTHLVPKCKVLKKSMTSSMCTSFWTLDFEVIKSATKKIVQHEKVWVTEIQDTIRITVWKMLEGQKAKREQEILEKEINAKQEKRWSSMNDKRSHNVNKTGTGNSKYCLRMMLWIISWWLGTMWIVFWVVRCVLSMRVLDLILWPLLGCTFLNYQLHTLGYGLSMIAYII